MRPDAVSFRRALARVVWRGWIAHMLYGAAAGLAVAGLVRATGAVRLADWGAVAAVAAVMVATRRVRTRRHAAVLLERAVPESRNAIITAEELLAYPDRANAPVRARVLGDADRFAGMARAASARPLGRPVLVCLAALATVMAVSRVQPGPASGAPGVTPGTPGHDPGGVSLHVTVNPPAYSGRPAVRVVNPDRVDALAGSTVQLAIDADPGQWRIRFGGRALTWSAGGTAVMTLTESGYFALEPLAAGAAPRLVPVGVEPDRAPVVHIDAPGRDLIVPDARRTIGISAAASDDLALGSVDLRYTKVSGTGEDFEFVEGSLPIALTRESDRNWKATASIGLSSLDLEPGDSLVYRAVARDRRPGTQGEASSDTFFIEIAGPGQIALEGFDLPPDQARYALSQQMVVLKIERLRARERALSRDALREAALAIAAEQRAVRAYFIFLMGGHVEDEEVEAAQSSDIQEGRLENTARREISSAVHLMTRAEQGLMATSTATALPPARSAVEALQRAFGRNRYILRTPPSRAEIDPSRRLSGSLSLASSWRREVHRAEPDARLSRIGTFLSAVFAAAKRISSGDPPEDRWFARLAEQALAIDPAESEWQQTAARLSKLGEPSAKRPTQRDLLNLLSEAVRPAVAASLAGRHGPIVPGTPSPLERAWAEAANR